MSDEEFFDALEELDLTELQDLQSVISVNQDLNDSFEAEWAAILKECSKPEKPTRNKRQHSPDVLKDGKYNRRDVHHSTTNTTNAEDVRVCPGHDRREGYYIPKVSNERMPPRKSSKGKGKGKRSVCKEHGREARRNVDQTRQEIPSSSSRGCGRMGCPSKQTASASGQPTHMGEIQRPQLGGHVPEQNGSDTSNRNTNDHSNTSRQTSGTFEISELKKIFRKKFNTSEVIYSVKLNSDLNNATWISNLDLLYEAVHTVLRRSTEGLHEDDLVRLYVHQKGLETPIVLTLRPLKDITVQGLLDLISKMLQSNQSLVFNETFEIHAGVIRLVRGGKGTSITNIDNAKIRKKCIVVVKNSDKTCAARAIVIAKAHAEKNPDYKRIAFSNMSLQTNLAVELCRKAGVDPRSPTSLDQMRLFESALGLQIVVVSADACNTIVYKGSITTDTKLYLLHHNEHYDVITKMNTFYGSQYYCHACFKAYSGLERHRCSIRCTMCYTEGCVVTTPVDCSSCNRRFRNQKCYDRHMMNTKSAVASREANKSICERYWLCTKCTKLMQRNKRSPKDHRCEERFCMVCDVYHMGEHRCFMRPSSKSNTSNRYIFLDYETNQQTGRHVPNFCVAQKVCSRCIDIDDINTPCDRCSPREVKFEGPSTANDVGKWLFNESHKGYTIIAHNAKGYDAYFLLRYLVDQSNTPEIIYNNGMVMTLKLHALDIRVIDSLNLIPTRLANLPKTFNIKGIKGDFPHFFNTDANQDYVGPIPDIKYYGVDSMSEKDRQEFIEWHTEQKESGYVFDFRKEISDYCSSDVTILRRCCLKFRELILGITTPEPTAVDDDEPSGLDPLQSITIASLCFSIFQTMFLKRWQVALVPAGGIVNNDQYSQISIQWLEWLMHKDRQQGGNLYIRHALNEGEHKVGKISLDGFHSPSNTAYEFLGCFHHACLKCFAKDTIHPLYNRSMESVNKSTMEGLRKRESLGFKCIFIWEHEFTREIQTNPELKSFIDELDVVSRLNPKDAFFGGRTSTSKMYYEAKGDTQIKYLDFTSLYPYINKYAEYPLAYPTVITRNFGDISQYKGFIKCKVIPPRKLYHPVLPYRCHDRLMFPLCKKCCEGLTSVCYHNDDERALTGTWVTFELLKSLEEGYRLVKVYEVYHFEKTIKYDGKQENTGLFTEYINKFLKIKQESSGFPEWVKSEADKNEYIRVYEEHEGIKLDKDKIEKNEGLRSVAKLALNSLWGKFAQRNGLKQNTFVSSAEEFYRMMNDKTVDVTDFHDVNEHVLLVDWCTKSEHVAAGKSSNIYIAAFTTCHARLRLYDVLKELGERALYCDTDSVIFYTEPGQADPPTGDFLGQLTSELAPGDYITVFASGGPKNYAYKTALGHTVTKVRGFTLNFKNSKVINFQTVCDMVRNTTRKCPCKSSSGPECSLCVKSLYNDTKITRDKTGIAIINRKEKKDYRIKYIKRVIQRDFDTLPYGY